MKPTESSAQFEPASVYLHRAVLAELIDLGIQQTPQYGKKHQVLFIFEVEEEYEDGDNAGQRKLIRWYANFTWGTKQQPSHLRTRITKWQGFKDLEEMLAFDLEDLVGQECRLDVSHKENTRGLTRAVIDGILPPDLPKTAAAKKKYEPMEVSDDYVDYETREAEREERQGGGEEAATDDDEEVPF